MDWEEKKRIEKIHVFLFDFGGILGINVPRPFIRELAVKYGKREKEVHQAFFTRWKDFIQGKIAEERFYELLLLDLGLETGLEEWIVLCKEIARSTLSIDQEGLKLVKELKKTKKEEYPDEEFIFGILSNTTKEWKEYIEKTHPEFFELFDKSYLSFELEMNKPNEDIFLYVIKDLQKDLKEILFIDDSLSNIEAAKQLGINVLHVKRASELKEELQKMELIKKESKE